MVVGAFAQFAAPFTGLDRRGFSGHALVVIEGALSKARARGRVSGRPAIVSALHRSTAQCRANLVGATVGLWTVRSAVQEPPVLTQLSFQFPSSEHRPQLSHTSLLVMTKSWPPLHLKISLVPFSTVIS
eukprot:scaffold60784_cov48-Phaeocystis_antarctica.AAC.2